MTRHAWLILAWGIVALTIVDGAYSVRVHSYATNEYAHHNKENNHNEERLDGPVFTILVNSFDAAERLIDRHEKLLIVLSTIAIAGFTATLWRATTGLQTAAERQITDMQESLRIATTAANAAEHANRVNYDAFIADQRPWVSPDIALTSGLKQDANGISLTLQFILKNTGKSPALNVWVSYEIYPSFGEGVDIIGQQKTLSERERQRPIRDGGWGLTLFPGDKIPLSITTTLGNADIQRWDTFMSKMGATAYKFLPPITLIGCVDYKFVFGPEHHQTGFILDLHAIKHDLPGASFAIPKFTGEFPVNELRLGYSFLGSGITD